MLKIHFQREEWLNWCPKSADKERSWGSRMLQIGKNKKLGKCEDRCYNVGKLPIQWLISYSKNEVKLRKMVQEAWECGRILEIASENVGNEGRLGKHE